MFLQVRQHQFPGAPSGLHLLLKELTGSILWSIPQATGMSEMCTLQALPLYGPWGPTTLPCIVTQGGWGLGYLALLVWATAVAVRALLDLWRQRPAPNSADHVVSRQALVLPTARLLLLLAAWLTLSSYMFSEVAAEKPWSQRYLIGLLIATPALLWPLLGQAGREHRSVPTAAGGRCVPRLWCWGVLSLLSAVMVAGIVDTFSTIPAAQAANAQEGALVDDLISVRITRIYSGYWICDRLIFQSREGIICSVINTDLRPGLNRYVAYQAIVAASPSAAYVLPDGSDFAASFAQYAATSQQSYQRREIDGYVVYIPVGSNTPTAVGESGSDSLDRHEAG